MMSVVFGRRFESTPDPEKVVICKRDMSRMSLFLVHADMTMKLIIKIEV